MRSPEMVPAGYGVVTVAATASLGVGPPRPVDQHPLVPLRLRKPTRLFSGERNGCPAPGRCHTPEEEATSGRAGRHPEGATGFAAGPRGSRSSNWAFLNIPGLASEEGNGAGPYLELQVGSHRWAAVFREPWSFKRRLRMEFLLCPNSETRTDQPWTCGRNRKGAAGPPSSRPFSYQTPGLTRWPQGTAGWQ